jgi:hypothetical protein
MKVQAPFTEASYGEAEQSEFLMALYELEA